MLVLQILFWILLILSAIGVFIPDSYPNVGHARWGVVLIELGILGYFVFNGVR